MFYLKKSLGKDKVPFMVYKLKTMRSGADAEFNNLVKTNGLGLYGKIKNDPRITPFGKFLRRTLIDELPQFVNLLKGDMKLVGVRPRSENSWNNYPSYIRDSILETKPGLMSPLYGFEISNFEKQIAVERLYILKYKKNPIKTDIVFGLKAMHGFLFKGYKAL